MQSSRRENKGDAEKRGQERVKGEGAIIEGYSKDDQ